jgi:hypothetical protein
MRRVGGGLGNERGSTLVLLSVMLFGMLALGALAIDLGSLRSARSEAQRAADAIALAGASAFRDFPWTEGPTSDEARVRALAIARVNQVRTDTLYVENPVITTTTYGWGTVHVVETPPGSRTSVTLNIIPDSQKVRAWVRYAGVQTFFGGLLAKPYGHVQARATAWATEDGPVVDCLKPFVIPDMWYETDPAQDVDSDHYMDPIELNPGNEQDGESWKFQPPSIGGSDYYAPYDPKITNPTLPQTGYGSPLRNGVSDPITGQPYPGDVGLPLVLATQTGAGNTDPAAERMGNAFWILDFDPDANTREEIMNSCAEATIGDPVPYDGGSRVGQVQQGINYLVNLDPNAEWDPVSKTVVGVDPQYGEWTNSPRVVIVGLIDPNYWIANTSNNKPDPGSVFTNFARIFLLPNDPGGPPENIQALFIGSAPGGGGGPTGGPLVKVLQLIE